MFVCVCVLVCVYIYIYIYIYEQVSYHWALSRVIINVKYFFNNKLGR